jgi:rod shape-determining protein MreB
VLGLLSLDIGIDLGTANTLVSIRDRGIVINEPSWVAINKRTRRPLAIGAEAKEMVGRTPADIVAIRPLRDGVISEFEITEAMLKYFIDKAHEQMIVPFPRPRVVVGVPSGVTEVEKRAVYDATISAGAREAYLIEEPMAAAIGAGLPIIESRGSMIVDIGGGTSEVAIFAMGGIVVSRSIRVAGDEMDEDILQYARSKYNLLIGERMAERVKIGIGSAFPLPNEGTMTLRGRNLADLMEVGICLAGGGAQIKGLAERVEDTVKMRVWIAEDSMTCVARGAGRVLEDLDNYKRVLVGLDRGSTHH